MQSGNLCLLTGEFNSFKLKVLLIEKDLLLPFENSFDLQTLCKDLRDLLGILDLLGDHWTHFENCCSKVFHQCVYVDKMFMTRQIMVLETHDGPFINTKRNQYAWFNNSEKVKNVNTELGVVQT